MSSIIRFPKICNDFRTSSEALFCDGQLISSDMVSFPIHRPILIAASEYFKEQFINFGLSNSGGGDTEKNELFFPNINSTLLDTIINFIYTGYCDLKYEIILELMPISIHLKLPQLLSYCCKFLKDENLIDKKNAIKIWQLVPKETTHKWFTDHLEKFILHNFQDIFKYKEFTELTCQDVENFLKNDNLNVHKEISVFEAIVEWVEANEKEISYDVLKRLLSTIRFGLIRSDFFSNGILRWNRLECYPELLSTLLTPASSFTISDPLLEIQHQFHPFLRPRVPYELMFTFGGWSVTEPTSVIETFSGNSEWRVLYRHNGHSTVDSNKGVLNKIDDDKPSSRAYHGLVEMDNLIWLFGGYDGTNFFSNLYCFDPELKIWTEKSCMRTKRCYVSYCVLDRKIVALGGYCGYHRLSSVEQYDPDINQWSAITSLNSIRSDASACVYGGKIFIAGGYDGQRTLKSVEMYNPETKEWIYIDSMHVGRSGLALMPLGNYIYSIAGYDENIRTTICERFNPNLMNGWEIISPILTPRSNFAHAIFQNKLYILGGYYSSTISSAECYDPEINQWTKVPPLNIRRSAFSAVVIKGLSNARDYTRLNLWDIQRQLKFDTKTNIY